MSTEIVAVLFSGQLLLVLWEIYKGVTDRRDKKKASLSSKEQENDNIHKMVFRLYKDNLRQRILAIDDILQDTNIDLRAELLDLHDDVEVYIQNGGNGLIKQLYLHMAKEIRATRGESDYSLLYIENLIPKDDRN